jgi:hypothetical protein
MGGDQRGEGAETLVTPGAPFTPAKGATSSQQKDGKVRDHADGILSVEMTGRAPL